MVIRYWLFVTLTLLLTTFIGYGTYTTARLLRTWKPEQNLLLTPGENLVRFLIIAGCLLLGLLSTLPMAQLGWEIPNLAEQLIWGIVVGLLLAFLFYQTTRWFVAQTGERFYSATIIEHIVPKNGSEFALVALALVPSVFLEELLFRSLLLGGLTPIAPIWLLLLAQGILFGLMHSPQGLWGMAGAAIAGLLFGLLFLQWGSLLMPFMAHYVTNLVQIGVAMRLGRGSGE